MISSSPEGFLARRPRRAMPIAVLLPFVLDAELPLAAGEKSRHTNALLDADGNVSNARHILRRLRPVLLPMRR